MQDVVIVAATRTPIGSFHGALAPLSAVELGTAVVRSLLEKTAVAPEQIDEVILGQVLTAGCGQNPARQTALRAGLPSTTPALTINLVCGSGLKAVHQAVQAIRCGDAQIVIAGGQESMSNAPYFLDGARAGLRLGHASMKDSVVHDGLWDAFNDYHMGITAENLADKFVISREQQDAFALRSQQKPPLPLKRVVLARKSRRLASHKAKSRHVWWTVTNSLARILRPTSWRNLNQHFDQETAR